MKFRYLLVLLVILVSVQAVHAQDFDLVVARGDLLVDSMVAQVYTQAEGVPLVITNRGGFTPDVRTELDRYSTQGPNSALIIGGPDAVPTYIEKDLKSMNYTLERIWDVDRYGTAAEVSKTLWEKSDTVVIVPGDSQGNLLIASQRALDNEAPLLFTETGKLNEKTKNAILSLETSRIIIVGELDERVVDELENLGGVEQTAMTLIRPKAPTTGGIFVVGVIVGLLVLFLFSSLWGVGFLKKDVKVPYDILGHDEKTVVDLILKEGEVTQDNLIKKLKLSRPKISRITSELEERNIVERKRQGKTYTLHLKKEISKG